MNMASVAIQVLPLGKADREVCRIVDEAIAYIKSFNLPTVVGPFETTIEGDYETLMEIVKNVSLQAVQAGAADIITNVKICVSGEGSVLSIDEKTAKHLK